jgi:hypothetical protein
MVYWMKRETIWNNEIHTWTKTHRRSPWGNFRPKETRRVTIAKQEIVQTSNKNIYWTQSLEISPIQLGLSYIPYVGKCHERNETFHVSHVTVGL